MSTPEARSETITSDEEDFKSVIPHSFEDVPNTSTAQQSDKQLLSHTDFEKMDSENDPSSSFSCRIWENVNDFMDDNLSTLNGTDHDVTTLTESTLKTSDVGTLLEVVDKKICVDRIDPLPSSFQSDLNNSNMFQLTNTLEDTIDPSKIASSVTQFTSGIENSNMYNDNVEQDIKFSPSEIILPTPSTEQYNYNLSNPLSSHVGQLHSPSSYGHPLPTTHHELDPHTFVRPLLQPQQTQSQQSYGQYSTPSDYHPNMWYPNAPYGSSNSYYRSYSGNRYPNCGSYPHDPMLDMLQLSNSGREARNRAEKNRRDKLNGSIQELSTMVPHVAESPRRVDKTAVLRFAAHGLRLQYIFGESLNNSRPQYTDSLMKLLDRFFIALTCHGQIVLISSSVEQHLGHCQTDLYGQNILNITHPEDHSMMKQQLIPSDLDELFDWQVDDDLNEPKSRTLEQEESIDIRLRSDKRKFTVRLARAGPRSEPTAYEIVKIEGNFKRSNAAPRGTRINTFPSNIHMIRRSRGRDDTIPLHAISGNDIVLIATARIIRLPKVINSVTVANAMEYKTRHLIDGSILDCDQRIGLVAGYMTDEVQGLSPFTFMHQDDMRWVIVALRQMYDCRNSTGESTYRLMTRNGRFIYLRSKGYLEVHEETKKVHSFFCVNTLLDEEEGKRQVEEMKMLYSPIVNAKIPQTSVDEPASKNPRQLEKAVLCLIQNLQQSPIEEEDDDGESSTESFSNEYRAPDFGPTTSAAAMHRYSAASLSTPYSSIRSAAYRFGKSAKTPPLALVPPETSSVKTSISKSVNVVNVTAAKHLPSNKQEKTVDATNCEARVNFESKAEGGEGSCLCQGRSTATDMPCNKRSADPIHTQELKLRKRRLKSTEIEHVLSNSLDQLGRTLDEQLNAAIELRDKSNKYEMPNSNHRIDELMEEHQLQSKIYVDIKSEYEVQKQNKCIDASATKHTVLSTTITPLESHCIQQQRQLLSDDDNDE
nr:circadian locomoter output cycles protein kaput isoform X2 [Bactrocera oleae]